MSKVCNYSASWEPSVGATPWSRFEAACRGAGVAPQRILLFQSDYKHNKFDRR